MESDIVIKVENLSKVFSLHKPIKSEEGFEVYEYFALRDVSFEIKKGESVGIVGPNGSGKSTLLRILAGITKPTSGKVQLRGKIASILEIGAGFHPELSGRENIFLNGQILGFKRKEIQKSYNEIVQFSGIEKFIDEPVKNYSNGMYVRLAFSILVHLDFDVYFLDEVLGVGDAEFRQKSQQKLHQLHHIENKTIVSVSHYLWEMAGVNRIFYLKDGIMDANSSKEEAIKKYSPNESQASLMINNPFFLNKYQFENKQEYVQEYKVYLKDKEGVVKDIFKSDDEIILEVEFLGIKEEFNFGFVLLDRFGNPTIELGPIFDELKLIPGKNQTVSATFPKRFFNSNLFTIDIVLFDHEKVLFFSENVANFSVVIEDLFRGTIYERTWGAVKPFLKWESKIIN